MAIIDSASWYPQGNETIYAHRDPKTNLSTYTKLIVQESQEAVLFSKGQIVGKFGPGTHTLNTENLPILRNLFGIPFGGKNPFTAEIWFVNKVQRHDIQWKVGNIEFFDPAYNTQIPLEIKGRYGLKLVDAEKFLLHLVGTNDEYDEHDLTNQFDSFFGSEATSLVVQYGQQMGYNQLSTQLNGLSANLNNVFAPQWENWGFELISFNITRIGIDLSAPNGQTVAGMLQTGRTWQQEQMFNLAKSAMDNVASGSSGLMGGLLAMNMMGGMSGGMMSPQYHQANFGHTNPGGNFQQEQQQQVKMVYCSNCAKKFSNTTRFCPHCGDEYNPCSKCGTDNDKNAKRCVSCGTPLTGSSGTNCPNCNSPLPAGATFCGNCGKQVSSGDNCSRCGTAMHPSVKFCPKCGNKR